MVTRRWFLGYMLAGLTGLVGKRRHSKRRRHLMYEQVPQITTGNSPSILAGGMSPEMPVYYFTPSTLLYTFPSPTNPIAQGKRRVIPSIYIPALTFGENLSGPGPAPTQCTQTIRFYVGPSVVYATTTTFTLIPHSSIASYGETAVGTDLTNPITLEPGQTMTITAQVGFNQNVDTASVSFSESFNGLAVQSSPGSIGYNDQPATVGAGR